MKSIHICILLLAKVASPVLASGRAAKYLAKEPAERALIDNLIAAEIRQKLEADRTRLLQESAEREIANAAERQALNPKYDNNKSK